MISDQKGYLEGHLLVLHGSYTGVFFILITACNYYIRPILHTYYTMILYTYLALISTSLSPV